MFNFQLLLLSLSLLFLLGVVAANTPAGDQSEDDCDDNRRRSPEERGLPRSEALKSLARTYLETQHRLWPKLVGKELPSKVDSLTVSDLASGFRTVFLGAAITAFQPKKSRAAWNGIAAAYVRYSCDHSNPRSLDQQLKLALEKAKQENYFIPWEYVFADAAVSGTIAERTGYQLAKAAMTDEGLQIESIFIDEIGRASRDMVEAMNLGRVLEAHQKLLITVSDGIDMRNPMWKPMLSIFAALQEWFIDQLRHKVHRGLNDAFDEGKIVCDPGFGYTLVPTLDGQGQPVLRKDGRPYKSMVINEEESQWVIAAFRLYTERKRSPARIAKLFNRNQVQGRKTWDGSKIRKMLDRHRFVGIRIKGTTETVPESPYRENDDRDSSTV